MAGWRDARNSSRIHLRAENAAFAADVAPGMRVLDAGAGTQPYRALFDHAEYESADFNKVDKPYGEQTYICDLASIPVADARYDRVVFNQVLEHLPEPLVVLRELYRVLKPGGRLICTCPLAYEEHEVPYDFYRYTQYGLRHLFETAGFEIERLDWLEGYLGTVGYQFSVMARGLPDRAPKGLTTRQRLLGWPVVFMIRKLARPLAKLFWSLDVSAKVRGRGHPKNYVVIASKPDQN